MSAVTAARPHGFTARDIVGGLSVAFIVIPQALAYAEIAGMPPVNGLYAAALPAIAAAPYASSRYLQTGPTAMTALLAFGAVSVIATPGSDEYVGLALLLAIVVGVARLALGLLKAGALTNYMSPPVVLGFTTAAAVLIVSSQVPTVAGLADSPDTLIARLPDALARLGDWQWQSVVLGLVAALVVIGARRVNPLIPGVLIAVVIGVLVGAFTDFPAAPVGDIPTGFPPIDFGLPWSRVPDLLVPGFVIAMVGFAEPTAIARTMAARDRERWNASRELISQGVANLASGFTGGFPVGGSFSRSAIGQLAGARTRWAGAVTGLAVLAFMPFAGVLSDLPKTVLATIVIVAVVPLLRIPDLIRLVGVSWGQGFIALVTVVATLVLSPRVDLGVIVGVVAAATLHIYREGSRTRVESDYREGRLDLRPVGVLFYGSAGALEQALADQLVANPECQLMVLDLTSLGRIDYSGIMMLRTFANDARSAGLEVKVANIPPHAEGIFERAGGI